MQRALKEWHWGGEAGGWVRKVPVQRRADYRDRNSVCACMCVCVGKRERKSERYRRWGWLKKSTRYRVQDTSCPRRLSQDNTMWIRVMVGVAKLHNLHASFVIHCTNIYVHWHRHRHRHRCTDIHTMRGKMASVTVSSAMSTLYRGYSHNQKNK